MSPPSRNYNKGNNRNIKRVIFHKIHKFDGSNIIPLSISQIRQIGGRAGRFGTAHEVGEATTFHDNDLGFLKKAFEREAPSVDV